MVSSTLSRRRRLPFCLKNTSCPTAKPTPLSENGDKFGFITLGMMSGIDFAEAFDNVKFMYFLVEAVFTTSFSVNETLSGTFFDELLMK